MAMSGSVTQDAGKAGNAVAAPEDALTAAIARVSCASSRDQLKDGVAVALRLLFTKPEHKEILEATGRTFSGIVRGMRSGLSLEQSSMELHYAAQLCVEALQEARRKIRPSGVVTTPPATGGAGRDGTPDLEYDLPPELAHLLRRLDYVVPELGPAEGQFDSFEKLVEAAVCRRLGRVMVFFQRHNPGIVRELPPIFVASPAFAEKFRAAVARFILPVIANSRQVRLLATSVEWANLDADSFWGHVTPQVLSNIIDTWAAAWDDLKLVETIRKDGTKVMQVKETTKELRAMLAPSDPPAYDLPRVGNREIETFRSLLDPAGDWWERLNRIWQICHDLYEQEKDPRIFQQKAREGALRDGLLNTFNQAPERWVDFLLLTCHRVFPRVSTQFLDQFTRNLGPSEAQREAFMPYTIRYLRQVRECPDIRDRERCEEFEFEEKMNGLRSFLKGSAGPQG